MVSTDALWQAVWANTSCLALTLGADTRLNAGQQARMIAIQSLGATNSYTDPAEDAELVFCLKAAMVAGNKGRG
jgi:hypothetical protein